jgi:hypothetical protein
MTNEEKLKLADEILALDDSENKGSWYLANRKGKLIITAHPGTMNDLKAIITEWKQFKYLLTAAKDFRDAIDGRRGGAAFAEFARAQLDSAIYDAEIT